MRVLLLSSIILFLFSTCNLPALKILKEKVGSPARQPSAKGVRIISKGDIKSWQASKRVALVVGVNNYSRRGGLAPLNYGASDARKMELTLNQVGKFNRVILLNDDTGKEDPALLPMKDNIEREFEKLIEEKPRLLLFYFSGHGFQTPDGKNVLAPLNAQISHKSTKVKSVLIIQEMVKQVTAAGIPQALFFLDACRENMRAGAKAASGEIFTKLPDDVRQARGVGVMMGTRPGGYSYENADLDGGVFTHFLVNGLTGGVQDDPKYITAGGEAYVTFGALKDYVEENVRTYTKKEGVRKQIPYTAGDYTGNFLVAVGRPEGTIRSEIESFVSKEDQITPSRVLYDAKNRIITRQFFAIGEGKRYKQSQNEEGISRIEFIYTADALQFKQYDLAGKEYGPYGVRAIEEGIEENTIANKIERKLKINTKNGHILREEYYGADGKLKEDSEGIARYVFAYDGKGNKIKKENFGTDGKLKEDSGGFACYVYAYDGKRNIIKEEYFGADGKLKEYSGGIARYVFVYDGKGNKIKQEYFGTDGKLKEDSVGIARYVYAYDGKGNKIKEEYFGADGKLKEDSGGIARYVYAYDGKGNKIKEENFGADGKLKEDEFGIAHYVFAYDGKGNKIKQELYGADGKLKEDSEGIARSVFAYDGKGNNIKKENFGADGNLKEDEFGIARYVYAYDGKRNIVKEENFGADGKLKEDSLGIARYVYAYDGKGNKIKKENFGADGKLKEDPLGIARYVYAYNKGHIKQRTINYNSDKKIFTANHQEYHLLIDKTGQQHKLLITFDKYHRPVEHKYEDFDPTILKEK